jgi:uncharacterized membrane protein
MPSLAAGHYFGMIAAVAKLMFEPVSIKPFMLSEEERIVTVNRLYWLSGLLLVYSGILAEPEYGK